MGGPVADEFIVLCRGRGRKMGDPGIDPAKRIGDIGTIDRNLIADEEIFGDILLDPFPELDFLRKGPTPVGNLPDLLGGLLHNLAEGRR